MKITVDFKKGLQTKLTIFVDKKIIEEKILTRLSELSKTANIKGFRPGKVPLEVLRRQFSQAVYGETLEKILRQTSTKAIEEKKIKVAGQPKLELKTHGEGKDLTYTLEIDELPSIKLKSIENIKFNNYEVKVTEEEVKKRIDDIAKNQDNFKEKNENESSNEGDLIVFDYKATIENKNFEGGEGKNTQIVIGKDLFIKGFDKQLLGVKKKQELNVKVNLPENYPKKELSNKEAIFKCKIINIKKPEPTKVDDNFATTLGAKDLNDLKQLVIKQISNQYKTSLDALSKEDILDQLEKLHEVDVPDNLIQQELSLITQEAPHMKMKNESKKIAKKRIKLGLILNEFGEKNNLKVEEQEIKDAIQKQIQSMPEQQKQVLDYYQKNPSASSSLRGSIYEEKIISLIKKKLKPNLKIISLKDAEKLLNLNHDKKHDHSDKEKKRSTNKTLAKKSKKTNKSPSKNKKIRKK